MMTNITTITNTFGSNTSIIYNSLVILLSIVGKWMILEKLEESGWKALIPFYGEYLIVKHIWSGKAYLAYALVGIIGGLAMGTCKLGMHTFSAPALIILFGVGLAACMAYLVLAIKIYHRLAIYFGHGTGYTLGLLFLEPLFLLMIGMEKDNHFAGEHPEL